MKIDARKLNCPKPVILTKRAIDRENPDDILVVVDNVIATENLKKLAKSMGYAWDIKKSGEDFYVQLTRDKLEKGDEGQSFVLLISSDKLGDGDEILSKNLMESLIYSMANADILPVATIFINRGVFLCAKNENTVCDLLKISEKTKILCCGLCLEYYNLVDELSVGEVTNMYEIYEYLAKYRVVRF